jgi:hypothetical protein
VEPAREAGSTRQSWTLAYSNDRYLSRRGQERPSRHQTHPVVVDELAVGAAVSTLAFIVVLSSVKEALERELEALLEMTIAFFLCPVIPLSTIWQIAR